MALIGRISLTPMGPVDNTPQRLANIERIRELAKVHNRGVTTLWALRNSLKKLFQDHGVSNMVHLTDDGKTTIMLTYEPQRLGNFLNARPRGGKFLQDAVEVAEKHGYEYQFLHNGVSFTVIP